MDAVSKYLGTGGFIERQFKGQTLRLDTGVH